MIMTGTSAGTASTAEPVVKKRARIFYLDLVRALAALLIVLTHFNNPYLAQGGYILTNNPFGIYVGGLGVSLFLIISGAALTVTYRRPINLKRFYWKRCLNIYPMFWTAWVLATLYFFVVTGGRPPNSAPTRSLIFTVLGMDGLVANFHVRTAYLLGEWFLGFILLYYLVFPLLLWAIDRFPVLSAVAIVAIYAATLYLLHSHPEIPSAVLLPTRLPELTFGIYFVLYVRRVHWISVVPAAAVLLVSSLLPTEIPEDLATTFVGITAFLILVVAGRYVAIQPVRAVVGLIAKYSYPIFLVHHVVIMVLFQKIDVSGFVPVQRYTLLAATCVIVFGLSVALSRVTDALVSFVTRAFQGMSWRPEVSEIER